MRPRGPSGDDWSEVNAGVDALDGPDGLCIDRGVIVRVDNVTACLSRASGSESDHIGGGESCSESSSESAMISRWGRADDHAREGAMAGLYVSSECLSWNFGSKKMMRLGHVVGPA